MLQRKHISRRLDDAIKAKVLELADEIFTSERASLRQRASEMLEKLPVLPSRKLKFLTKVYYDQSDEKLVRDLKKKFGSDAILELGNWSAANTKCHKPTRNKNLIHMLKKNGHTVHLIDEFKTSSKYPKCEDDLENFKVIKNLQSYRRLHLRTNKFFLKQ